MRPQGFANGRPADRLVILRDLAVGPPCYYEELAAARAGTATIVLVTDAIP